MSVQRPAPTWEAPPGYHHEAVEQEADWVAPSVGAGRCRWGAGPGKHACGRPAVASLMRGFRKNRSPWDYCEQHLYGRWVEDGKVMGWRVVEDEANIDAGDAA